MIIIIINNNNINIHIYIYTRYIHTIHYTTLHLHYIKLHLHYIYITLHYITLHYITYIHVHVFVHLIPTIIDLDVELICLKSLAFLSLFHSARPSVALPACCSSGHPPTLERSGQAGHRQWRQPVPKEKLAIPNLVETQHLQ